MPALVKLPLPPGKLGVVFSGKESGKPAVKKLSDESPMKGKVKEGYIFEGLHMSDGTKYENMSVKELVETLKDTSDEEGRVLVMMMGLPQSAEVMLPQGDIGARVETVKGKPTITKIAADAPASVRGALRVGYIVDKVMLEDGTEISGHSAEEIEEMLAGDAASSGRRLSLLNPEMADGAVRSVTLPMVKEVELPTTKLGVSFKGSKLSKVTKVGSDSSLKGKIRVGFVVDSIRMPNGVSYVGYGAIDMTKVLKDTATTEGRVMVLKSPENPDLPTGAVRLIPIPRFGNAEEIGITVSDDPVTVEDYSPSLQGKLYKGDVILAVDDNKGKVYENLDAETFDDAVQDCSGSAGRVLVVQGGPPPNDDDSGEQA